MPKRSQKRKGKSSQLNKKRGEKIPYMLKSKARTNLLSVKYIHAAFTLIYQTAKVTVHGKHLVTMGKALSLCRHVQEKA